MKFLMSWKLKWNDGNAKNPEILWYRCDWPRCPNWVNRVALTVDWPFPVYPDQRTSSDRPGISGWCHVRTQAEELVTSGSLISSIAVFPFSNALSKIGRIFC